MDLVDPAAFEQMVSVALDGLPPKLGRVMRNVAVTVDQDSPQLGILGLYRGVPLTARTSHYSAVLPDQITIYRHAICAVCRNEQEVVEQVRRTVIHEVGHHFGIGDERLHELGW
ncbi:predicted Zn-dependent protease with MMP-like domain [Jatrophihabitans sp. GAS493]|uniref:metallopeptidase family protein n=1 Tax=Jatrophihabitans sp. GAS493 TaxID=1907575 RepID=UPI000BB70877|nr:metallopeptidase family protein [Jatrophihabitans sp. GAS493]SOD74590.1 predicted Zn-dependent protease with MMP-like domain [Jatrophihabitans sp. GAS493]